MAKKKEEKTNVCRILDRQKIPYVFRTYEDEDPLSTREYGLHVASALGENAEQCFKTLVARGASGAVLVYAIPVAETLDLKAAAKAAGEKSIALLPVAEITAVTGYVRGGCSPVGMKKNYPTIFHESVLSFEKIYLSAGRVGAQVEVPPAPLIAFLRAETADIIVKATD